MDAASEDVAAHIAFAMIIGLTAVLFAVAILSILGAVGRRRRRRYAAGVEEPPSGGSSSR